ncbi:uncharacterized protein LOC133930857 [Phragmites australis]|uniref:uncharacterized protein LOC133930857 n=1 Tax=Phragmites australis TaxID=29695 RepID=UPI002D77E781|nr:uncharacterized protein LOC133930857 [Phragmites australis]
MGTLLLLLLLPHPGALADADFVARTCNNTAHPDACRSLLGSDPRSPNATTVLALANIGLDAAGGNARDSAGTMHELSDGKYAGTTEGDALLQCAQVYGNAVEDLDGAREPLNSGAYGDASLLVSGAEDAGGACERAFADRGVGSVVSDVDQRMAEQCGVAWDLIDLLDV